MMENNKPYKLEDRTLLFTQSVIKLVNQMPKTIPNNEIAKQVVRSAGSVGANYIEANEAISKKDFALRIKICRKESKETRYWLNLLESKGDKTEEERKLLVNEAMELTKIFNSIVEKTQ